MPNNLGSARMRNPKLLSLGARSRDMSLCTPITRYGKFLGMGLLASLLFLSAGHADKGCPMTIWVHVSRAEAAYDASCPPK